MLTFVRSTLLRLLLAGGSSYISAVQVTTRWSRYGVISPFKKLVTAPACLLGNLWIPAVLLRCPSSATGKKTHPRWPIKKERNWEAHTEENRIPQALLCFIVLCAGFSSKVVLLLRGVSCFNSVIFVRMLIIFPLPENGSLKLWPMIQFFSAPFQQSLLKSLSAQTRQTVVNSLTTDSHFSGVTTNTFLSI